MIAYKEIAQIKNVRGVNPVTGDYSYEENGRGYLCIDGVLLEKEEPALDIVSVGEYVYVWYGCGRFELYSGHTLLKIFEKKVFLLDRNIGGYIGYHIRDPKTFEASENILSVSDGQPLLAQNVPYRLYKVGEEVIGYKILECKLSRLNYSGEVLWTFDLPLRPRSGEPDNLDKVLGIAQGLLWICTRWYRLIALDLETGKPVHLFSGGWFDEDHSNYIVLDSLGWCFFREAEKTIVLISNFGVQILDATTAKIIEGYSFSEVDPQGIGAFEYFDAARLQGDYFTFIAERPYESYGTGWAGVFDLKARKLLWTDEVTPKEKRAKGLHLVITRPVYYAGNKIYVLDNSNTLYIYQKQWRLKAQVRPQSEVISTAAQYITPAVSATPPSTEEDRPIPPFVISLCKKIPRLLPYLIVLLLGMLIWHFRLDIFSPSHEHSTLASSLIITQDTKSQVVLLKEAPYFMRNRQRQIEEIFWSNISVDTLLRYPHYKVYYFLQTERLEDKVGEIGVIMREDSTYIYHMQLQSPGMGFDRIDHIFSAVSHYYSLQELYASKCEELGIKSGR